MRRPGSGGWWSILTPVSAWGSRPLCRHFWCSPAWPVETQRTRSFERAPAVTSGTAKQLISTSYLPVFQEVQCYLYILEFVEAHPAFLSGLESSKKPQKDEMSYISKISQISGKMHIMFDKKWWDNAKLNKMANKKKKGNHRFLVRTVIPNLIFSVSPSVSNKVDEWI